MTTCLRKSCSFGLPCVPFVNCCQFMYLVISLLVLRVGCGIWLYQFLIIPYLFTFATNARSDKTFLLTSKLCPLGAICPCPGDIYMYKIMKNVYKNKPQRDFLKLVANDQSDQRFLLTSKFCPLGLSAPDLWLYTFIKSWKDVYKVRDWRDLFETCNKWP